MAGPAANWHSTHFCASSKIAAYVRHVAHGVGGDIRGIERVRSKLEEHTADSVPIRADPDGFILGDQRVNGLWGLFSVSARVSGLIPDGPSRIDARSDGVRRTRVYLSDR